MSSRMQFTNPCPVALTSRILGGRWKPRIVWALVRNEPLRFSALRRACPPVSDRILTKELRELEAWGLISRKEYPVIPPKTEYRLTELGNSLRPIMAAMAEWGLANRALIVDSPATNPHQPRVERFCPDAWASAGSPPLTRTGRCTHWNTCPRGGRQHTR